MGRALKSFKFATICKVSSDWPLFIVLLGLKQFGHVGKALGGGGVADRPPQVKERLSTLKGGGAPEKIQLSVYLEKNTA